MLSKSYFLQLLSVVMLSCGISVMLYASEIPYFNVSSWWVGVLFFTITTLFVHLYGTKGDKNEKDYVFKLIVISMGRLLLCLFFILFYFILNKPSALPFACHFMIQYILFTVFEIASLLRFIKQP